MPAHKNCELFLPTCRTASHLGRNRHGTVPWVLFDYSGARHPLNHSVIKLNIRHPKMKASKNHLHNLNHTTRYAYKYDRLRPPPGTPVMDFGHRQCPRSISGVPFDSCQVLQGYLIIAHKSYAFFMSREGKISRFHHNLNFLTWNLNYESCEQFCDIFPSPPTGFESPMVCVQKGHYGTGRYVPWYLVKET